MKTASYFTYRGPGRIGISVGNPRGIPAGYRMFKPLAPTRAMLHLDCPTYRMVYFRDILNQLDPAQVMEQIEKLAQDAEPVLLCFEKPPFTPANWCHRRIVADWFQETLGLDVPEHEPERTKDLFG